MSRMARRTIRFAALAGLLLASATAGQAVASDKVVRIGHQSMGAFAFLKPRGLLEARLKPLGYTVTWQEFPAGPQLLEALKAGSVDFAHGGEAPPIFAQAAGAPFLYIGHEPAAPEAEAILVPQDSPIRTVADLKGKKVGLNKGSNVHYLLVRALQKAGKPYTDVTVVFLSPAEGRAAFEQRTIDAWAIWDPYRAAAELSLGARPLADGTGLVSNHEFYFAAKPFAQSHAPVIDVVLGAARDVYAEVAKDIPGTAKGLSTPTGFPAPVIEVSLRRRGFGVQQMSAQVIAEQQKIADTFKDLGLIPAEIKVSDAVRKPTP